MNKLDGALDSIGPAEYLAGAAEGYRPLDVSRQPAVEGAPFINLSKVDGPLPEAGPEEKLLLVCTKGRRAYMLQNRLKAMGYRNTLALEGGTTCSDVTG